ncbi:MULTISPECIES: hypothetical protein [Ligilactobacillus]|uniref:hypothetical protein n=1 Tax=Ligilactobacillus TaxID=2767887 RepID=UPI000704E6F9|nr:hypothetical protein [Ligilactobacillus murinus]
MGKNEQQEVLENITAATLETLEKVGYDNVILIAINSKIKDPGEDVIALKGSVEGLAYMTIRLFERLPQRIVERILTIIRHYRNKADSDELDK